MVRSMRLAFVALLVLAASAQTAAVLAASHKFPEAEYANAIEREMIEAAFQGKIDKVKQCLAKGARIDARFGRGTKVFQGKDGGLSVAAFNWTALMAAIESDRFEIAELLISNGASVKMDDGWGCTPLGALADKATPCKQYDRLAALLIKKGADVNAKTGIYIDGPGDVTPLHDAASGGHLEMVRMLVAAGADVNAETSWGDTPLDRAPARSEGLIGETLKKEREPVPPRYDPRTGQAIREILTKAGGKKGPVPKRGP